MLTFAREGVIIFLTKMNGVSKMKRTKKALDMRTIKNKPSRTMSTKEALSDVKRIDWSEEVKNGSRKVKINKMS